MLRLFAARRLSPARLTVVAIAVLLLALAPAVPGHASAGSSSGRPEGFPVRLTDASGVTVTLERPAERVVSLVPSLTEIVCAVAGCGRLVGVDEYSDYPAEVRSVPKLGNLYEPNPEAIVAARPDLVLVSKYGVALAETLRRSGVTVFVAQAETFDELFGDLEAAGALLGQRGRAAQIASEIRREFETVEKALQAAGEARPRVYYEVDETPYSAGPGSFIGVLIDRAGGRNIVPSEAGLFPKLSPESVVAADPEVVLLADAPYGVTAKAVAARPGWAGLAAVRDRRVVEMTREQVDWISRPGPRVALGLRFLLSVLHPDVAARLATP